MMQAKTGAGPSLTMCPHPNGPEWGALLSSNDPWYRLLRALADLYLAGQIEIDDLQEQEQRWTTVHRNGKARTREFACPAARQIAGFLALTWMEPSCICWANWEAPPCTKGCEPLDRRAHLRELLGE